MERPAPAPEPAGGDPPCWMDRLCEECGAFVEGETCWRCGHRRRPGG